MVLEAEALEWTLPQQVLPRTLTNVVNKSICWKQSSLMMMLMAIMMNHL